MPNHNLTPDKLELETAYHEAGHAVMACVLQRYPQSVSIVPDGKGAVGITVFENDAPEGGWRYFDRSAEKCQYIRMRVLIEVSGTIAHDLKYPGRAHDMGDETDARPARDLVGENVSWEEHESYLHNAECEAAVLLKKYWSTVERVALALLERKELSRAELIPLVMQSENEPYN
jgi:hypothetical protein